jgi:hypothetical protein
MRSGMTRLDWWLGVMLLTVLLGIQAVGGRYEWRGDDNGTLLRVDRWTGNVDSGYWGGGKWVSEQRGEQAATRNEP